MKSKSMKPLTGLVVALFSVALFACNQSTNQQQQVTEAADPTWIFPKGDTVASAHFSAGRAWVHWIMPADSIYTTQLASVTYQQGSRTKWHYHPAGQILIVVSGIAYYQEEGKPKQILSKGDVAKCPPGVHHWHGAAPDSDVKLMAINPNMDKGGVVWLEATSDEEYNH